MHDYVTPAFFRLRGRVPFTSIFARRLALCAALCLLALFPLRVSAGSRVSRTGVSKTDKAFANEIAPSLLRDMKLASITAQRGQNKAVRNFAKAVLEHRTQAHGELRALARKTRLVLPALVRGQA